ncbi:MAG: hypothetical protein LBH32_04550 [Dysgonamonadaceae bacterium]|jgi:hypothetical protein|nr:hypothetical protein [Dysgonamonadaceae bacterium]
MTKLRIATLYVYAMRIFFWILLLILTANPLSAQFFYDESCRGTTGNFTCYGNAPGYTASFASNPDASGSGWLRLTNSVITQMGYVLLDKSFPSTMGVTMEFDFKVWGGGSTPADGFSIFLYDGDPGKTFTIGSIGGCLGYTDLKPAYLGIGIDEYGNFSNEWGGPVGNGGTSGKTTLRKNAIIVRDATYTYVAGTGANLNPPISGVTVVASTSNTRPDDDSFYRRVRIEIEPVTGGMKVTVYLKTSTTGDFTKIIGPANVIQPTPSILKMGFAAATGGSYANHEVRDVVIRTPGDLNVFKNSPSCANYKDSVTINTVITNNMNYGVQGITMKDTLPAGFYIRGGSPVVTSSYRGAAAVPTPSVISNFTKATLIDGRTECTYTISANADTYVYVTYNGGFDVCPLSMTYVSGAKAVPPVTLIGATTKYASVTGCVRNLENDTVVVFKNDSITFNVCNNDVWCNAQRDTVKNSGLRLGTLRKNNSDGSFTYKANNVGVDSVSYYAKCGTDSAAAKVYMLVINPNAKKYVACQNAEVKMGFTDIPNVTYRWYSVSTGGTIITTDTTYTVTKNAADIETWWVEPVYKNKPLLPRIKVELTLSESCGGNPVSCVTSGALLFKEDFGGNDPSDPKDKPTGIPQVINYNYVTGTIIDGSYSITKENATPYDWYKMTDHTYPGDNKRGYFAAFNATSNFGQFYERTISNLCAGMKLYFSAWIVSLCISDGANPAKVNHLFLLEDMYGNILAQYNTGNVPDGVGQWKNYGFSFVVPDGENTIILRIINNASSGTGNNFGLDDIEIRLCSPAVTLVDTPKDTLVCKGLSPVLTVLSAKFTNDGTFFKPDNNLVARWYRLDLSKDPNTETVWMQMGGDIIFNHEKFDFKLNVTDVGYYRLAVADQSHINSYNCRSMSDVIKVATKDCYIKVNPKNRVEFK